MFEYGVPIVTDSLCGEGHQSESQCHCFIGLPAAGYNEKQALWTTLRLSTRKFILFVDAKAKAGKVR